jgi:hypothetical protein
MTVSTKEEIPAPGQWPVDPQEDVPVSKDRIWVDGCFDFSHHGESPRERLSGCPSINALDSQDTPEPCSRPGDWENS